MYNCQYKVHEIYGNIIEVSITNIGSFNTPFQLVSHIKTLKKILSKDLKKIKILINNEIVDSKNLDLWAKNEYEFLPKCFNCYSILEGDVATHRFANGKLFCQQLCADSDFQKELDKTLDEEEIDFL